MLRYLGPPHSLQFESRDDGGFSSRHGLPDLLDRRGIEHSCFENRVIWDGIIQLPIQKTLQLTNQWPFKEPAHWLTLPKRLDHDHPKSELAITNIHFTDTDTPYELETDDEYIIYPTYNLNNDAPYMVFTAYKQVDKKIHPVSMQLPPDCEVI